MSNLSPDVLIAKAILDHINRWPDKPSNVRLDSTDKAPVFFSVSMQPLAGTKILKKYITGTFIGLWPFAVYIRLSAADTAKRLDAVSMLEALGEWVAGESLPDLGDRRTAQKLEMTSLPSVAAQYEDGAVDYQAIFNLTYKQE